MVNKNFLRQFLFDNLKDPYSNEIIRKKGLIQRYLFNNVNKNNIVQPKIYRAIDFEDNSILYKDILNIIDSYINYENEFYIILCVYFYNHTLNKCIFFNNYSRCYNKFLEFKRNNLNKDIILFQCDSDVSFKKITKRTCKKFYENLRIINYNTYYGSKYNPSKIHLINPTRINYNDKFIFIKKINGKNIFLNSLADVYIDFIYSYYKHTSYNYFYSKMNEGNNTLIISKNKENLIIKIPLFMNNMNGYYLFNKLI